MVSRKDYIPDPDGDFHQWQKNLVDLIAADPAAYGLTPAEATQLTSLQTTWRTAYHSHITAHNNAQAAAETKEESRDGLESGIRILVRKIQANPSVTDAQREQLGITVPDKIKTPLSEQIVLETPPPVIQAKCTGPKTVRIDWYPTQAPGESEALPQGIDGIGIWVAEGGIPADPGMWRFLAMDTNSPYIHNAGNAATVTLAYKAQWFDRRKRVGPFCGPVTVAVTS
jgi:hypothetical protein